MLKHMLPNSSNDCEPLELRVLKRRLAELSCDCHVCKSVQLNQHRRLFDKKHKEVQAEQQSGSFDWCTKPRTNVSRNDNNLFLRKDVLCPSCYFTLNLFRGAVTKVVKDEESGTKAEIFCRDKSTGKRLKFVEKTTSVTDKPALKYSNLSMCDDDMSEYSSDLKHTQKKKCNERVTFCGLKDDDRKEQTQSITGACLCLDNFVDSIRPPLEDMNIWKQST